MPRADICFSGGNLGEGGGVMLFRSRGIKRGPFVDDRLQASGAVEIHVRRGHGEVEIIAVAEHLALAGIGKHDEFMGEIAADRAAFRHHRD